MQPVSAKLNTSVYYGNEGTSQTICQEADCKVDSIRASVLQTIRNHMPITTLFQPELKIDLGVFIKDQMFMRRIAEFLAPLTEADFIDGISIAKHFENGDLLSEIKVMFKDANQYLPFFYEACADAINKKSSSGSLKSAMEGRIFTLKNALIAQIAPKAIYESQLANKISPQKLSSIEEEGASFIRKSLHFHLHVLKGMESASFREYLTSIAEQLMPFTRKITSLYLQENGKDCPTDILSFRNPTGYNYHGLVAGTVMETCLNVLGYTTRLMVCCDLEPKVTLATMHNLVEVTSPDNTRYIVDPSYIQFHKDVCLEDTLLPKASVLVLAESEVDEYIEKHIMSIWKANFQQISANNTYIINQLKQQDKLLSFVIKKKGLLSEYIPTDKKTG